MQLRKLGNGGRGVMKIARMPKAEVVRGPWRRLAERKRLAMFDALVGQESGEGKYELILRILQMEGVNLVCFGNAVLELCEMEGMRSTMWQRIEPRDGRRTI
jgi:hypothetical protein